MRKRYGENEAEADPHNTPKANPMFAAILSATKPSLHHE